MQPKEPLEGLFNKQQDPSLLTAAEQFAQWTLPTVFTKDLSGMDGKRSALHRDYQSYGALLLNNAATKVTQALFPESLSFFKLQDTTRTLEMMSPIVGDDSASGVFSNLETRACSRVFLNAGYAAKNYAVKLLMITGNALEFRDPVTKKTHVYSVRDYTVKRDGSGTVMQIILRERIAIADLPRDFLVQHDWQQKDVYDSVQLFTGISRKVTKDGNITYEVTQEVDQKPVGSPTTYPENLCPYIPLTWNLVQGEHYGRGLVEDYAGGLARLSELCRSLTMYEVEAMRLIHFVNPSAGVDIDAVNDAMVGEFIQANLVNGGIQAYEGGDARKMEVVKAEIQQLFSDLARAFMYTGNTRDAERVTAYEIRQNINEAQSTLGDAYSNLAEVWHQRLAYLLLVEEETKILPVLQAGEFRLDIVVGTAALNRASTVDRLLEATLAVQQIVPVLAQSSRRFNVDAVIDQIFAGYGIDRNSISYTKEQLQQMQEQGQQIQDQTQQTLQAAQSNPELAAQQLGLIN